MSKNTENTYINIMNQLESRGDTARDRTMATGGDGKNAESTVSFDRGSFYDG